ncbi:hypothetical protein H6P87_00047 [Rickettsia tillamookensis]|uniref:Autotransporter domain-containing protein n=2 Tax=Rickettsia tillamookensis TaxID=2761623 RepID=A0A9E6MGJ9_9RICK|nr:hypothetical protein H6P87_00047 [Rickettsia tillamookensis]
MGQGANNATLIINGNDISAVDSIILGGGQSKIVFQNPITVDAEIYARTNNAGYIEAKNDTVFNKTIGFSGGQNHSITGLLIEDNKTVTLKSDIYASDIELKANSKLIIDASKQNITVRTGIATDLFGNMNDDTGRIQIKSNTKNAITFYNDIGGIDERVAEIDIARGKKTEFKSDVYAKNIKVAANDVEFHEKLDMQRRNGGVHIGNLEFTNYGKVKFHKDFTGDITTSKINVGEVTYVNTPNIYGVGALNKRIEKLVFTGNHPHNLHKNIHAARTEFDAGTYNIHTNPITIDGNANINGSTFDLRYDLIFTGNVELSNNIRINSAGNRVVFQNHAPTVNNAGTNITFNINGAPPANEAAALAVLHINVGGVVFPPVGSRYDVGTATLILPGLGGAQVQQQQQQVEQNQQQNNQQQQQQVQQNQQQNNQQQQPQQVQQNQQQQVEQNQQQQVQREDNERAIAEENNRRIEEQRLQAENQQRQANEIREYVNKPEPQKLAEAINNTIVAHAENTFVTEAQKEVIKEKSAFVMQNPEKHAVELAKELVNNKAELKEVAKVANDDTVVVSKTKQEQSLLFVANLAQVAPDNAKKVVEHLTEQGTRSVSVANVTAEAVTANINNHLSGGTMVAVAAGDEETPIITKKGLWVAGTFGSSNQNAYKGNPSYKGTVSGGTIGGDLYIGENSLVGLAYSRMNSDFKFKGSSTGDKLSAESDIISLYGQQQFSNGLILQEIFSASNSKINKKDLRPVGPNSYKTASGKYTSKAYGFEGNVGYQFSAVDGINLMPNIGIRYNTYKDNAYTESGTGVNNMYVAGKSGNLTTGIAGIKLTAPKRLSNDTQIVPGLHASVENSFSNKQPKVKARFIWADNYFENTTSSSTPKVGYNVGASLLTAHKNIELLATYNCNLRSKYTSHQGSLKLKILF